MRCTNRECSYIRLCYVWTSEPVSVYGELLYDMLVSHLQTTYMIMSNALVDI